MIEQGRIVEELEVERETSGGAVRYKEMSDDDALRNLYIRKPAVQRAGLEGRRLKVTIEAAD